MEQYTKPKKA